MTQTVSLTATAHDRRTQQALELVKDAGQWARVTDRETGRRAYGIPATCKPGTVYITTTTSCTCPDATYRGTVCKHQMAARIVRTAAEAVEHNQPRQACGVCDVVHPCDHCPRMQACTCQRSRPPLLARLMA